MEKTTPTKNRAILCAIIAIVYFLQFFVFPNLFPKWYPRGNEASAIMLLIFPVSAVAILKLSKNLMSWIIADAIYGFLMFIYDGRGLYGLGMDGIALDGAEISYHPSMAHVTIAILLIILFIFQIFIIALCAFVRRKKEGIH